MDQVCLMDNGMSFIYLKARLFYMDSTCHSISSGMWNVT
jgi:hypothetical protein